MARDRKGSKGRSTFSNSPFRGLKLQKAAPPPPARSPEPPAPKRPNVEEDEAAMFLAAVDGVERLEDRRSIAPPLPPLPPAVIDEEAEALAQLAELVAGDGRFDIASGDTFLEGVAPGVDRGLLSKLKRGDFAVQARLDLHGMTGVEARKAAERFLVQSRREGMRCVQIVHGRGIDPKERIPALKRQVESWLEAGNIGRALLGFATAREPVGDATALVLLLRR